MRVGRVRSLTQLAQWNAECRAPGALGALISRNSRERHMGHTRENPAHADLQDGEFIIDPAIHLIGEHLPELNQCFVG
jgi:hypothetical protein